MGAEQLKTWDTVFADEKEQIRRRRGNGGAADDADLVGLAFSGGGIRSATFGLGVLEHLKSSGLLQKIDYLSTVSGGGYIGSWLSANCLRAAGRRAHPESAPANPQDQEEFATASRDWLHREADWKKSIDHLRRFSNYLSPKIGFFSADTWTMATIWLRNALLVQLTLFFAFAALLLVPRLMFLLFQAWPAHEELRWITVILFVVAIAGIAANQLRVCNDRDIPLLKAESWRWGLGLGSLCFGLAYALIALNDFSPFTDCPTDWQIAAPLALCIVLGGFFLMPVAVRVLGMLWWGKTPAPRRINFTQGWTQSLVVGPLLATGFLLASVLWGQAAGHRCQNGLDSIASFSDLLGKALSYWPFPLSIAFVSLWLLAFCSVLRRGMRWREIAAASLAPIPAILVLHLLLCSIMMLLRHWAAPEIASGAWQTFIWAPALVLFAFSLAIVVLIGMLGRQSPEGVREWWSRLGAWMNIYGIAWLLLALATVYGPLWAAFLLKSDTYSWISASTLGGWLATTLAGLLAAKSGRTDGAPQAKSETSTAQTLLNLLAIVAPFIFIGGILIGISTLLHLVVGNLTSDAFPSTMQALYEDHWPLMMAATQGARAYCLIAVLLAGSIACLGLLAARVDINEFSLNAFYRNRLARCYLGAARYLPGERQPQNFTGFDCADDPLLAELASSKSVPPPGPLHIVNCALNLGGSSDLAMHTRHSASFTLTPYACGSSYPVEESAGQPRKPMGYLPTEGYGGRHGQPSLAQAISVSGAAASPNMGYHTSPVVAFMLTVFNVRLGWWFPNPRLAGNYPSPWFSLRYLVKELFGGADEKSRYLMVSDGGHFENLAAYELVRRRCRVIVISDAECDPEYQFAGLGSLIRMCETDLDASIAIDVGAIRAGRDRHAVGRITYHDGASGGILIYLKAALNGSEDTSVQQYKAGHPTFPHETTADQFYGEDQFESYRRLGREVAETALGKAGNPPDWISLSETLVAHS